MKQKSLLPVGDLESEDVAVPVDGFVQVDGVEDTWLMNFGRDSPLLTSW